MKEVEIQSCSGQFYAPLLPVNRLSRHHLLPLLSCVIALAFGGCALWPRSKPKPASSPQPPRMVGTIVLINEAMGFALIDAGMSFAGTSEQALKSFSGDKETGVLTISEERRRPFLIADIVKGAPKKGDQVFQ